MATDYTGSVGSIAENYSKYAEYFTTSSSTEISIDTFFTLLLAEMSNQDPLEPTSNTEFISQLASFTSMQTASETLAYTQTAYATSLAGKTVTVASWTGTGLSVDTGVVTDVDLSDSDYIEVVVNGTRYPLSGVMVVNSTEDSTSTSTDSDGAYAVSLIGKYVTVSATISSGTVIDEGIAESIEIEDGEYRVVVNGLSYSVSDVVKVRDPDEEETAEETEETVEETEESAETEVLTDDE